MPIYYNLNCRFEKIWFHFSYSAYIKKKNWQINYTIVCYFYYKNIFTISIILIELKIIIEISMVWTNSAAFNDKQYCNFN